VGYVEREAYAAVVLVTRMEEASLGPAPIWDDLGSFDGRRWRGAVDLVCVGFPCQPASVAGRRLGTADDRWLWPLIVRTIRDVEPAVVVIENVRGLLTVNGGRAFGEVLGDLVGMGYRVAWRVLSAGVLPWRLSARVGGRQVEASAKSRLRRMAHGMAGRVD